MEFMVQWFFLVKIAVALAFAGSLYKLYKSQWKSKFWIGTSVVMALVFFVSPIKLETNTVQQQTMTNERIKQSKVLPEKVTDNSFKTNANNVTGITSNDLPQ